MRPFFKRHRVTPSPSTENNVEGLITSLDDLEAMARRVVLNMPMDEMFRARRDILKKHSSDLNHDDMECLAIIDIAERLLIEELDNFSTYIPRNNYDDEC